MHNANSIQVLSSYAGYNCQIEKLREMFELNTEKISLHVLISTSTARHKENIMVGILSRIRNKKYGLSVVHDCTYGKH